MGRQEEFDIVIFEQHISCAEWADELYFKSWVELNVDVQAAGGVTIIVSHSARCCCIQAADNIVGVARRP